MTILLFLDLLTMDDDLFVYIATHPEQMTRETNDTVQAILALGED